MQKLLSTKEVAEFLNVNEKMVYSLVSEKGLPATKITGKWLFPRHLVEQWVEANTINYPDNGHRLPPYDGLLIVTGSNDPLLDRAIAIFNNQNFNQLAVFGNLGSMGGLRALRQNLCHIASSHLLQEDESEYNFDFAFRELDEMPAVVNFCRREQGILVLKGNPKNIVAVADLGRPGIKIVNRSLSTGTRLLLDKELRKAGINGEKIEGYETEVSRHLDVGLEILSGRADAGPAIRAVAKLLDLDFIPLRWERFDLMISKERFFDEGIQRFLGILHEPGFQQAANREFAGYDVSASGQMVFPQETEDRGQRIDNR
ncbi:MAG: helix-turn-helix transcriptional regulator [Deltaproteobacteria bacterium]|jgi:excisionase family DNA binding protein|nr:helix-turn-helix transcriptional regulator [Deltaproteobacteria bacterium]MBW2479204.1 helix-turn-helix transcriptional regulator [Deltaproteobacteria bacterium]